MDRAGVGAEEARGLPHDLLEDPLRFELRRKQGADACELLRERPRAPLALEHAAPLEGALGRLGEVARELEVVVGEQALL